MFRLLLKDYEKVLKKAARLERAMARRIARKTVRAGAKPLIKAVKAEIRAAGAIETKLFYKSIGQKVKRFPSGVTSSIIGSRGKTKGPDPNRRGQQRIPVFYEHLLESGVKKHGKHPGFRARHIKRRAFRRTVKVALRQMESKARAEILSELRKQ